MLKAYRDKRQPIKDCLFDTNSPCTTAVRTFSISERMNELEEQRSQLEKAIDTLGFQINDKKRKVFNAEVMHKSLAKFSQIYDKATPLEIKELLPYFIDHIKFTNQEIQIALFDQPTEKGLFVNRSDGCAPEFSEWLPIVSTCNQFFYSFEYQKVKRLSKRKIAKKNREKEYVNPIERAHEFQLIMQKERLNQSPLARKLGISRIRIHQILSLLKLPKEQQNHILQNGKKQIITERKLRTKFGSNSFHLADADPRNHL